MTKGQNNAPDDLERTARKTVTLKGKHIAAIQGLQEGEEDFSTTLQRLLDSHPAVAIIVDWVERSRRNTEPHAD